MVGFPDDIYWDPSMVCAGQNNTDNCLVSTLKKLYIKMIFLFFIFVTLSNSLSSSFYLSHTLSQHFYFYVLISLLLFFPLVCRVAEAVCWSAMASYTAFSGSALAAITPNTPVSTPKCVCTTTGSERWWITIHLWQLKVLWRQPHEAGRYVWSLQFHGLELNRWNSGRFEPTQEYCNSNPMH